MRKHQIPLLSVFIQRTGFCTGLSYIFLLQSCLVSAIWLHLLDKIAAYLKLM